MKNDQEKILYPNMQLSTMFELKLIGDQWLCYMDLNGIKLNSFQMLCNLNHSNTPHFTPTSEAYHTHFKMV